MNSKHGVARSWDRLLKSIELCRERGDAFMFVFVIPLIPNV